MAEVCRVARMAAFSELLRLGNFAAVITTPCLIADYCHRPDIVDRQQVAACAILGEF